MTGGHDEVLVFDAGPLNHVAQADWLGVLKAVVGVRPALITDIVADELRTGGARDTRIARVPDLPWIEMRELRSDREIEQYAYFASLLVRKERNRGEASVLALAKVLGATAVIDDLAGRKAAAKVGVSIKGTLGLLLEAIRMELLTVKLAAAMADDLIQTEYRLPLPGGFEAFAAENGLG